LIWDGVDQIMAMTDKKSRILYVKRFLDERTDEAHPAGIVEIISFLADEGIAATRKTVAQDIKLLMDADVDIVRNKSRQNQYFIGDRHFEMPELKLLIDAVQASNFLTAKRSNALIGKLLALASPQQAADLVNNLYFEDKVRPKNEKAYLTADCLLTAICLNKRVNFMYYDYSPEKKKLYKHNRKVYEFSPWAFIWNNDSYYAVGYSESHNKAVRFRIDRIASASRTEVDAVPMPRDFDLASFVNSMFYMYDGTMLEITLKCDNSLMTTIVDRFGEDVETEIADPGHFYAKVNVSASKTFFGWVFSMDGGIEIIAPSDALEVYRRMLCRAVKPFAIFVAS